MICPSVGDAASYLREIAPDITIVDFPVHLLDLVEQPLNGLLRFDLVILFV